MIVRQMRCCEDVVQGTSFAIHADRHGGVLEQGKVLRASEMAPLVAVPDGGGGLGQRALRRLQDKGQLGQVQFPADHIAGVPVEHGDQVEPAHLHLYLGDVAAPGVIGPGAGPHGVAGKDTPDGGAQAYSECYITTGDPMTSRRLRPAGAI